MINTRAAVTVLCVATLIAQEPYTFAQPAQPAGTPANSEQNLTAGQLDSLVAPIALYPDPILSQVLVASTYPLEIVEAGRWLAQHSNLKGRELADAAAQQPWDASVQALVILPDVLRRLDQNVSWAADLGNAFLAQEQDVMNAVQRLRKRAYDGGVLKSSTEQTVSTSNEDSRTYIVIQPADPQVVFVPQYNPVAVWGPPPVAYPWPSMYYPPSTGAIIGASAISFGVGMAVGAIWGGGWGGWGWGAGWGRGNVVINNTFISSNRFNRVNVRNGNNWVHNPAHRRGMAYNNRNVANRFQGANRPNRPGQGNIGQGNRPNRPGQGNIGQGGNRPNRPGQGNVGNRPNRPGQGNVAQGGRGGRGPAQGSASRINPGNINRGGNAGNWNRGGGGGGNRGSASRAAGGGGNRGFANRSMGGGGGNRGFANRSMGGGGARRGGGGGGGGRRGGGGGRRR